MRIFHKTSTFPFRLYLLPRPLSLSLFRCCNYRLFSSELSAVISQWHRTQGRTAAVRNAGSRRTWLACVRGNLIGCAGWSWGSRSDHNNQADVMALKERDKSLFWNQWGHIWTWAWQSVWDHFKEIRYNAVCNCQESNPKERGINQ